MRSSSGSQDALVFPCEARVSARALLFPSQLRVTFPALAGTL
jgi:hypothetical protein